MSRIKILFRTVTATSLSSSPIFTKRLTAIVIVLVGSAWVSRESIHITNPSFEADALGSTSITGWTSSNFSETAVVPSTVALLFDGNQAVSIDNSSGDNPSISQVVSGLDTSKKYVLEFAHDTSASNPVVSVAYGPNSAGVFGGGPGLAWSVFTPTTSSGAISFTDEVNGASAQVDAVSLHPMKPNEVFAAADSTKVSRGAA